LLALGAAEKLCPVHNTPMKQKLVPVIFLMDRHNLEEWQAYTNARAQLFPYSDDKVYRDVADLPVSKKTGDIEWEKVATNVWIYICPICEERKHKWRAEHPLRKHDPGEVP
jgi:hypothetical protein